MMEKYKLSRRTWSRFFTWTHWRIQAAAWWSGKSGLNVIETFEVELPDKEEE